MAFLRVRQREMKRVLLCLLCLQLLAVNAFGEDFNNASEGAEREKDPPEIKLLKELAEFGDLTAQFNLAVAYEFGKDVPQDYEKAAYWYTKSAEQGLAVAQSHLGVLYANGIGVARDYERAAYWYEQAAEQGEPKAQNNLGAMNYQGQGIPQDYVQAYFWWLLAAVQGNRSAHRNLGTSGKSLTADEVAEAYRRASEWWRNK